MSVVDVVLWRPFGFSHVPPPWRKPRSSVRVPGRLAAFESRSDRRHPARPCRRDDLVEISVNRRRTIAQVASNLLSRKGMVLKIEDTTVVCAGSHISASPVPSRTI